MLIQWQGLSPLEATWEDVSYMKTEFLDFNLEDKVVFMIQIGASKEKKFEGKQQERFSRQKKNIRSRKGRTKLLGEEWSK